jgi:glycosyltransferase involved in cell wall biosynthesis
MAALYKSQQELPPSVGAVSPAAEGPLRHYNKQGRWGPLHAVHIVAGLELAHGGPSYSVPRLCEALGRAHVDTTLLSILGRNDAPANAAELNYRLRRFAHDYSRVPGLNMLRHSSGLLRELRLVAASAEVVHNHGLWLMPNVYAGWEAARARKPLVVSPRGMLSQTALAFSRFKKRAFWQLLQGPVVRASACLHATSESEYQDIRAFGLANPVAIIANGIDLPEPLKEPNTTGLRERVVLSLGRIHPKKGLEGLVRAWAQVELPNPDWQLLIVGPAEGGHDKELRTLAASLGLGRVSIEGPLYGCSKLAAYRDADLFVLPTLNENFGITVSESLAAGTPVISTKGAPWCGLDGEGCGWWIDHGVEPLAKALGRAMAMPRAELRAMGARGHAWMQRNFSWDRVACEMLEMYAWLSRGQSPPPSVRFS